MQVGIHGSFPQLLNAFNGISRSILEGISINGRNAGEKKSMQIDLMECYLNAFTDANPDAVLILYDQFTNGLLETVKNAPVGQPKKQFLDAMMQIITKAFEKFKEDCEKND